MEEDTTISLSNTEHERFTGYSREEVDGKMRWTKIVYPEDVERMITYHRLRRLDPDTAPRSYESRVIDKKGRIKQVFLTVGIIPGTKRGVVSLLDIIYLKQTE